MSKTSLLPPELVKHRMLDRHQLAELLNLNPDYVLVASAKGDIPKGIRVAGKKHGWPEADVLAFIAERRAAANKVAA